MAALVIDLPEAVQVDRAQRHHDASARGTGQRLLRAFGQQAPVRQLGQWVVVSDALNFPLAQARVGDIGEQGDVATDLAKPVAHTGDGRLRGEQASIPPPVPDLALPVPVVRQRLPQALIICAIVPARMQQPCGLSDQLVARKPAHRFERRVGIDDAQLRIGQHDTLI